MCFSTEISLLCSSEACHGPSTPYDILTSTTKCCLHEYLDKHMPWPYGCSQCPPSINLKTPHPSIPIEHFVHEDPPLRWRRGLCPTCKPNSLSAPPNPTEFTLTNRSFLYASYLNLSRKHGIPIITSAIASATLPKFNSSGTSPHTHTIASLYTAAYLAKHPIPIDVLLNAFPTISAEEFLEAYTKIFSQKDSIFRAQILKYGEEWEVLPKPCCGSPQWEKCPVTTSGWGTTFNGCTGTQVGGEWLKGAFGRWGHWMEGLGMNLAAEDIPNPCPEEFRKWNRERKKGFPDGMKESGCHRGRPELLSIVKRVV